MKIKMAAFRRTSNDVKLELNTDDDEDDRGGGGGGLFTSQSDIGEESEVDLNDNDNDEDDIEYLRQPSESFQNGIYEHPTYFPSGQPPPHPNGGPPPPPYDSQGETYPLPGSRRLDDDGDDDDGSSPIDVVDDQPNLGDTLLPQNSFRYPSTNKAKRFRGVAYPREFKKTLVSGLFMAANFIATTVSLSIVHERVPNYEPLPDIILDFFRYQHWALTASEVLLSIQCASAVLICVFHKHRFILLRRLFMILGLLYGYRAITMFVTVLPVANPNYECDPKLSETGQSLTFTIVIKRAVKILSGFGLSMNGQHVYCGDFIYSGHTMTFVLGYLVIFEYTSKRLYVLHWIAWINAITGVALLLMSRGHYSIDVIIAYWITTRLWYMYHAMACHPHLQQATEVNYFSRIWWWTLLKWFEENVKTGPIPNGFNLPLPKALCKSLRTRSRSLVNETSRLTRNRQRKYKEEA